MVSSNNDVTLTDEEIDDILHKDIIELLGITELSDQEKEEFRKVALEAIENRVYNKLLQEIEAKGKLEEYKQAEDIDKFIDEIGIDLDLLYAKEALAYKLQMKSYSKVVDQMVSANKAVNGGN